MALGVQALTSMAIVVPSVLAPVAAREIGVQASQVGILVACAFVVAIVAGLTCDTLIARYGPVRVFQIAIVLVASGLAAGFGGNLAMAFVFGAFAGTAHGLVNPASSTLLAQASPPQYRSLVFSIKQTGVPLGGAVAGILIPMLLQFMHWRYALLALGLASAFFLLMLAPFRAVYDRDRNPRRRLRLAAIGAPIAAALARREIMVLALSSSVFSAVQVSLATYLMLYLIVELGYSLVTAGLVFSVTQGMGIVGRPLWGVVADRMQAPRQVLAGLGIAMALCGIATSLFSLAWPVAAVVVVCACFGGTAIGWNGVYLAEVARLAPAGKVGLITAGTQLFTFGGALLGPPAFGAIVGFTGVYAHGFLIIALLPLVAGLRLAFAARGAG